MENKDIIELQEKLKENIDKAIEFAKENTKTNVNGEVVWEEE